MAQTKEGAIKARETMKRKFGDDFYKRIGSMGGQVKSPNKGFGTDSRSRFDKLMGKPKLAVLAGRKGGSVSRRSK